MSRYEVVLQHWMPADGYTHSETLDWLEDATSAAEYIKNYDGEIEPYWENGDTEVVIIEHLGGADDPMITYSEAWVSDVERMKDLKQVFESGRTHVKPMTAEQMKEPITSYDTSSISVEVIE